MEPTIPVTLLTGFLGSGKTTLVNHLLTTHATRRMAVVVNEFGELGIDAALMANRTDDILELNNGCVCCASRGDLTRAVSRLVSAGGTFDHILVEGSGLADPGPVIESLVGPPFADFVNYTGTVACVDAANFDANLGHAEAAYNQLTHADLMIINKTDLVSGDVLARIEQGLKQINAVAQLYPTVRCTIPSSLVLEPLPSLDVPSGGDRATTDHAVHSLDSVTLDSEQELDPRRLRRWLDNLPETVVRAKGVVYLSGDNAPRAVHLSSGSINFDDLPPNTQNWSQQSALVLIGSALDGQTLQQEFEGCIAQ